METEATPKGARTTESFVPVVELDTIRASDANTQYCDFAEIPLYIAVFGRFSPQKPQR